MKARVTEAQRREWFVPLRLGGVVLRPMTPGDVPALFEAGRDPQLWQWTVAMISNEADMRRYVEEAMSDLEAGTAFPFVTTVDGEVVGSTRFGNIDLLNARVEIGWTWLAPRWQRTFVNTTVKYLMLQHAFETIDCERVELKTDALNLRSRSAILRIGATEEGVLRHHMRTESGRWRDTVYFSVLADEWPAVKRRLEERVGWNATNSSGE